jgi:hypothetical protein
MEKEGTSEGVWQRADSVKFWREISPPDHVVQFYENEDELLDCLLAFTVCGFNDNESVVIIGIGNHLQQLDSRLRSAGYDLFDLRLSDQYITLDATQTLCEFTINGVPDPILFNLLIANILKRAKRRGQKVRIFGELVSLLWTKGNPEAALCLEQLWTAHLHNDSFCRFCAYPKSAIAEGGQAMELIGKVHTHVVRPSVDRAALSYMRSATTSAH